MSIRPIALCALILALALLTGCAARPAEEQVPELLEPVGVRIDTATVTRGDIVTITAYEGSVVAAYEALSFPVDGRLDTVTVYPGMPVRKGQTLLTLDLRDAEAQAQAIARQIERVTVNGEYDDELARLDIEALRLTAEHLAADGQTDPAQVELAWLDVEQAELDLKQAQELRQLELQALQSDYDELSSVFGKNTIVAPFDGHLFYETTLIRGTPVQAWRPIVYVTDPSDLRLVVDTYLSDTRLASADYYALIDGERYEVQYEPMTREEMSATILSGRPLPTRFRVIVPEGMEGRVTAGQYAALCLETNRQEDVLTIPNVAIYPSVNGKYVYVIDEDGGQTRRYIETGRTNGIDTVVTAGLEEGETVYVRE